MLKTAGKRRAAFIAKIKICLEYLTSQSGSRTLISIEEFILVEKPPTFTKKHNGGQERLIEIIPSTTSLANEIEFIIAVYFITKNKSLLQSLLKILENHDKDLSCLGGSVYNMSAKYLDYINDLDEAIINTMMKDIGVYNRSILRGILANCV